MNTLLSPHPGGFDLIEFSTRRRVTVAMLTITLVLFGIISLGNLKVELLPDLSYPSLTVRTDLDGAAPLEIETLISRPAEEALGVVKGLRKLTSVSRAGQSDVVLEFAWGTDMQQAALDVRDRMETLQLPLEAKPPLLLRFNPSTQPIMRLLLSAQEEDSNPADAAHRLMELRRYADEELKRTLEPVTGVAAVKVGGGLEDEIHVDIDTRKLAQFGLSLDTVIQRLQQENVNLSGGRVLEGTQRYLVRTVNQFASVDEMRQLRLTTAAQGVAAGTENQQLLRTILGSNDQNVLAALGAGQAAAQRLPAAVRLQDVAEVRQGHKEREAIMRTHGREAVELAIYKEGRANTVATAAAVQARLARIRAQIPKDIELTVLEDQSVFISHAISEVKTDALMGGVLAVLIIFLFLRDGWSTFVVSLSLPVSIISTFFFMDRFGLSLNVMSLGGLALATGLVVDDSIVVLESIAKARERGLDVVQAVIVGTREVFMAVVASTLTTMAVFLPLVFVEGISAQLFADQALTIAIAIAVSLLVSMTLIPMLSVLKGRAAAPAMQPDAAPASPERHAARPRWQRPLALIARTLAACMRTALWVLLWIPIRLFRLLTGVCSPLMRALSTLAMRPYARLEAAYLHLLPRALARPWPVLGGAVLVFALTLAALPLLGVNLLPQLAQDRFEMTIKLPPGTPLARTDALIAQLQREHGNDAGVRVLYGVSGSGTRLDANPTESGENIGKLTVVMDDSAHEARLAAALRQRLQATPEAQVDVARPELFSLPPPLQIEIEGQDLQAIRRAGQQLAGLLRQQPHYTDVKSSVEQGFPEVQILFHQERAAALGLTTRQIADAVVQQVRGTVATRYSVRDRKIDVRVRVQESGRASIADLRRLLIHPGGGQAVELGVVADVVETLGPSEIHRADQHRVAIVSANLNGVDLARAINDVQRLVAAHPLGADIGLRISGQGQELGESLRSLLFAFALAVFLVYLVMASQFESLLHPLVILLTIPLALVGAVAALLVTGSGVSVVVFIGAILLVGLVVKNAILLIDKVNQLRGAGVSKRQALVDGTHARLRPIMMTTLCALFGFLPLALAVGEGAEVRAPMAVTLIGGLLVSTLLTLIVIPVVYDLMDRSDDARHVERARRAAMTLPDAGRQA